MLADLGWDADLSSLPAAEDRTSAVIDLHLEKLAIQAVINKPRPSGPAVGVPPIGVGRAAAPGLARTDRRGSRHRRLDDLVLRDDIKVVVVTRQPRVTRSLYHGTIYGVVPYARAATNGRSRRRCR